MEISVLSGVGLNVLVCVGGWRACQHGDVRVGTGHGVLADVGLSALIDTGGHCGAWGAADQRELQHTDWLEPRQYFEGMLAQV